MRFLVVDDHPLLREALGRVLRELDPAARVDEAADCEQGLMRADADAEIDLLLLDLNLPGLAGVDALRAWRQRHPAVPVVVLSADRSRPTLLATLAAGAAGFVPKSTPHAVMKAALQLVLDGGRYVPPDVLDEPLPGPAQRAGALAPPAAALAPVPAPVRALGLTPRQLEVLRLVAQGAPNKVIGRSLGLAERTVKAHVTAAMRAFQVDSRTRLALEASRLGLGAAPPP